MELNYDRGIPKMESNMLISKCFVVYSALVGKYDDVVQPDVVDGRFDYVLFTNDIHEDSVGVWQIRPILYKNTDTTRICRYVKTHPEKLLPEYKCSVWIDSNIHIHTDEIYSRTIELYEQGVLVSSMWHPVRKCLYEEAFAVVNMMLEHESVVVNWCHRLRQEGFPKGLGLFETNVLYRQHCLEKVGEMDTIWWNCISHYSRRDQLSFTYVLWKMDIPFHYFFGEGNNARNTEHLSLVVHNRPMKNHCPIKKDEAWLMRYCRKDKTKEMEIERLYYRLYKCPFPQLAVAVMGQVYRVKYWWQHKQGR